MPLPVDVQEMGTFKGDKGATGSLAFATAESVPWSEGADVEMVGPESSRGAHFKIPLALPSPATVANDDANAALLANPTKTRAATKEIVAEDAAPVDLAWLARRRMNVWGSLTLSGTGSHDGFDARTYAGWIAGIDERLSADINAGRVVRRDLGPSSDPTRHIFSYTAGRADAPHVLVVGGTHADERLSQAAAWRFFQQFVQSTDPAQRALRAAVRVTYIPTLTAASYWTGRANANGVNVNRNYNYYWADFVEANGQMKGAAPFDQPEAAVVKQLLDESNIGCVIDCHTYASTTPNKLSYGAASPWSLVRRDVAYGAAATWAQVYGGADTEIVPYETVYPNEGDPLLSAWAAHYLRYVKGRQNGNSVVIECPEQWLGSTNQFFSARAMQAYSGYITHYITQWLLEGQSPASPRVYEWYAQRAGFPSNGATVTNGGANITPAGTEHMIVFDRFDGNWKQQNSIDLIAPSPGHFVISYSGQVETGTNAASVPITVTPYIGVKGQSLTAIGEGNCVIDLAPRVGARSVFTGMFRWIAPSSDASQKFSFQLGIRREAAGADAYFRKVYVSIRFVPSDVNTFLHLPRPNR